MMKTAEEFLNAGRSLYGQVRSGELAGMDERGRRIQYGIGINYSMVYESLPDGRNSVLTFQDFVSKLVAGIAAVNQETPDGTIKDQVDVLAHAMRIPAQEDFAASLKDKAFEELQRAHQPVNVTGMFSYVEPCVQAVKAEFGITQAVSAFEFVYGRYSTLVQEYEAAGAQA